MQEKGSLINKIKDFFKIQKLKSKKRKEKEEKKKKKEQIRFYSRKKIVLLTIIGLFIGLFEPRKKQKQNIMKINNKITIIELKLDKTLVKEEIEKIEEKVSNINFELKKLKLKNKDEAKKIETKLISINRKIEHKKEEIEKKSIINRKTKKENNNTPVKEAKKNKIEQNLKKEQPENNINENKQSIIVSPLNKKGMSSVVIIGGLSAHVIGKVFKEVTDGLYFSNSEVKEKKKFDDTKKQDVDQDLESKDNKEENYYNQIIQIKKQKEVSNKKENNKFKEKWILDKQDISISLNIIQKELMEQEKEIEQFRINIMNMNFESKKRIILSKVGFLMKGIINITFSFLPIKLFKNKFVGTITSAIILNSRIKCLKRIMNGENNQIKLNNYKYILNEIKGKRDALLKTKEININSLNELESIKKEIMTKYEIDLDNPEIMEILDNLNKTKEKILKYNEKIDKKIEKNKEMELNQKQKIKKLFV